MFDIATLIFYILAFVLIASAVMVIASKNPVHSVLFLILSFFNAAGLFVLLGAEYLAMTLVIVYVGAVAVLFLFVVMMLDVNFAELRQGFMRNLPLGIGVALVLFSELFALLFTHDKGLPPRVNAVQPIPADITNTKAIGMVLYTDYVYLFQIAGLILLVAMIGAIVLTLRHRPDVRRQKIGQQLSRTPRGKHAHGGYQTGGGDLACSSAPSAFSIISPSPLSYLCSVFVASSSTAKTSSLF